MKHAKTYSQGKGSKLKQWNSIFQPSDGIKQSGKVPALIVVFSKEESQERDKCGP